MGEGVNGELNPNMNDADFKALSDRLKAKQEGNWVKFGQANGLDMKGGPKAQAKSDEEKNPVKLDRVDGKM